ncbi:MAG: DUF362 domain-containing protein [Anaerolineales bacterium]
MRRRELISRFAIFASSLLVHPLLAACGVTQEPSGSAADADQAPTQGPPSPTPEVPTAAPSARPSSSPPRGASSLPADTPAPTPATARAAGAVALIKTEDRAEGVRRVIDLLGVDGLAGQRVLLKPNFNSADPSPGSTHLDTLRALLDRLLAGGVGEVIVGDRSGMGNTRQVMTALGVDDVLAEYGITPIAYDALAEDEWMLFTADGLHWREGFPVPRLLNEVDAVVQTCNLKTHRYGGHFTLSLKNSVGLNADTWRGHSYMSELHGSPDQRRMIAEINLAYKPTLIVLDGVQAFTDGGPDRGTIADAGVVLAATDRVALDAVGVALLRLLGTTPEVSRGSVFAQEQLARAVELGLGVSGPEEISLLTEDQPGADLAQRLTEILRA